MRTTSPLPLTSSTVTRSGLRSWNPIGTVLFASESGAIFLPTWVFETGLCSSFSPSVTANAAAVQPRRASTTTIGRTRATGARV